MAERVEKFTLVAAAGASSQFQDHPFLDGIVTRVELYVPAGHAGLTQWSFWYGDAQLIPKTAGAVVVADDEQFAWDVDAAPTGAAYRSRYTNDDDFAHRFHIQVWLDELDPTPIADELPVLVIPAA